jgi:nitrogen-specific signal transduction histidine kinase/CheY-like chemotaxis protein
MVEREHAEAERRALESHLQHKQKLESLGVLAGGIAHDFNNLLVGIVSNVELALEDLGPASPVSPMLDDIRATAHGAADLCRQMLACAGRGETVAKPVDLSTLVRNTVKLAGTSISSQARIDLNLDNNLPRVRADQTQIQQVAMNLIINAAEALDDGGGTVWVSTGSTVLGVEHHAPALVGESIPAGVYAYLEVKDDGCGMDETTTRRLFEPFLTTKFIGRGLGLSALLGIVRGHGGAVTLDSEVGVGTTFKVLLPLGETVETQGVPKRTNGALHASGKILVVDDDDQVRRLTAAVVRRLGFGALTAASGPKALALLEERSHEVCLVILDLVMPGMGGEATFDAIRKLDNAMKVVVSSGYGEGAEFDRMLGKGLSAVLRKPFGVAELKHVIRDTLALPVATARHSDAE